MRQSFCLLTDLKTYRSQHLLLLGVAMALWRPLRCRWKSQVLRPLSFPPLCGPRAAISRTAEWKTRRILGLTGLGELPLQPRRQFWAFVFPPSEKKIDFLLFRPLAGEFLFLIEGKQMLWTASLFYCFSFLFFSFNMEHFANLCVTLAQGPC